MTELRARTEVAQILERLGNSDIRLVGVFGTDLGEGSTQVTAVLAGPDGLELLDAEVGEAYPALTSVAPGAYWYERALHDHFGARPDGHPRLDPLVIAGLHGPDGAPCRPPRPGSGTRVTGPLVPSEYALPRHLRGPGVFTIPHGPVRSGVVESLEYLVETPGEEIPRLQIRVYAKHRGVEIGFEEQQPLAAVVLAERVEGTASVAHALAYCTALEGLGGTEIPVEAELVRMLHAELERVAGHLEVVARLCESAALAVGLARFTQYKEEVQRIRHHLCGSRFGRGVVVPGGVTRQSLHALREESRRLRQLHSRICHDRDLLMVTSSFLDRLRGTGLLTPERARQLGAVGPVGRASGTGADVRRDRPYGRHRYLDLPHPDRVHTRTGDVQARLEVRWEEIETSFALIIQACDELSVLSDQLAWAHPVPVVDGRQVASVEGPQGEIVYVVEVRDHRLHRVWPRTASFHNLSLFHDVFHTDVLTDFPFIEASFAVSNAGVVM